MLRNVFARKIGRSKFLVDFLFDFWPGTLINSVFLQIGHIIRYKDDLTQEIISIDLSKAMDDDDDLEEEEVNYHVEENTEEKPEEKKIKKTTTAKGFPLKAAIISSITGLILGVITIAVFYLLALPSETPLPETVVELSKKLMQFFKA